MELRQRLIDLGYDPLFAEKTADEIVKLGATLEDFQAYVAHVQEMSVKMLAIKTRLKRRQKALSSMLNWTRSKNLWLELLGLLVMSPVMLPLSVLTIVACWWSSWRLSRCFYPWFREWMSRGIDSDKRVAIVHGRDEPPGASP